VIELTAGRALVSINVEVDQVPGRVRCLIRGLPHGRASLQIRVHRGKEEK
jgi:hypothetical protein